MSATIKISDLQEFDVTEYLTTEEDVAAYLTVALEDNDPSMLGVALGDIARARGITPMAMAPALHPEAMCEALKPGASLRFDTVSKV